MGNFMKHWPFSVLTIAFIISTRMFSLMSSMIGMLGMGRLSPKRLYTCSKESNSLGVGLNMDCRMGLKD